MTRRQFLRLLAAVPGLSLLRQKKDPGTRGALSIPFARIPDRTIYGPVYRVTFPGKLRNV